MNVIRYGGKKADLLWFLRRLPRMLKGSVPDVTNGGVRAILTRVGMVALAIIRDAYVVKARGDADASGLKWAPLSPKTIAYSRRHPGLVRDMNHQQRPSSMLSSAERSRWWALYRQAKARHRGDKKRAAQTAWRVLIDSGAKTILSVYGQMEVEILRDTGRLLNSLSPGIVDRAVMIDGQKVMWYATDQVFKIGTNSVTVGTNVPYAKKHHNGDPNKNLPQRKLWPDWDQWPDSWREQIYEAMRDGIADLVVRWLATGGK